MEVKDSTINVNVDVDKDLLETFIKALMEDKKTNEAILKVLQEIEKQFEKLAQQKNSYNSNYPKS